MLQVQKVSPSWLNFCLVFNWLVRPMSVSRLSPGAWGSPIPHAIGAQAYLLDITATIVVIKMLFIQSGVASDVLFEGLLRGSEFHWILMKANFVGNSGSFDLQSTNCDYTAPRKNTEGAGELAAIKTNWKSTLRPASSKQQLWPFGQFSLEWEQQQRKGKHSSPRPNHGTYVPWALETMSKIMPILSAQEWHIV